MFCVFLSSDNTTDFGHVAAEIYATPTTRNDD